MMKTKELVELLRKNERISSSGYLIQTTSFSEPMPADAELWVADANMAERYLPALEDFHFTLLEESDSSVLFEFEEWQRSLIRNWPENEKLSIRIIDSIEIKNLIQTHRNPVIAFPQIGEHKAVHLQPLNQIEAKLKPVEKIMCFKADGSFKIRKASKE